MENIKYYELNPSQEVVKLQCQYSLFKRVINIVSSATTTKKVDIHIMTKALNKLIERNDCLRLRFVKKDGKLMQYFLPYEEIEHQMVPHIKFSTPKQQEAFFEKIRKKPIDYMNGVVFEPYFCQTFDNKFMIVLKVCHLILDIYGLNNIYKDLFDVYQALIEDKELPPQPESFEKVVIKDLALKNNQEIKDRNTEFFTKYLTEREKPYYAGIHGPDEPVLKKQLAKNRHTSKMFFINNDTESYFHSIDKAIVSKAIEYCKEKHCSLANFFFYTLSVCCSKLNNDVKNMIPIELCNCRGTAVEKKTAGTKAQSIACYTVVEKEKTFEENFLAFSNEQSNLYRYIGFSDQEFQMLLHKIYKEPIMNTFYSMAFSFIPIQKSKDFDIQVYSNGKCALPAYLALMWDIESNNIDMLYDCYTKTHKKEDIDKFHKTYLSILNQVLQNSQIKIKDIEV